jgi:hypothetical protein
LTLLNIDFDDPRAGEDEIDIDPELLATATKTDVTSTHGPR